MSPPISVLLPAFDAEATLGAALESLRRQSFGDFECLIVDDGSRDRTAEVAARYARSDARFVLLQRPHAGIVAALEHGLGSCRGRYVARMDADDLCHKQRLARQLAALDASPELAGVGAHVWIFPRRSMSDGLRAYEEWLCSISDAESVRREAFVECPVVHPTLFIRREVLARHGYRDAGWPQDYDLVLRLLAAGERLAVLPERLLGWRDAPGRSTRTAPHTRRERIVACKAHHLAETFLSAEDRYVLWGYGDTGRALCRALGALGKSPGAIVELHPRRIGQRIAGAPVVHPSALGPHAGLKVVVSVAGRQARSEARARAAELGLREGLDFVVAA